MRKLGLNLRHNASVTVYENNEVLFHIEEERLSKVKRAKDPILAVLYAIEHYGPFEKLVNYSMINTLDGVPHDKYRGAGAGYDPHDFKSVEYLQSHGYNCQPMNHHLSHAKCAEALSTFETSLIFVVDGLGSAFYDGSHYTNEVESVYLCNNGHLELIDSNRALRRPMATSWQQPVSAYADDCIEGITKAYQNVCEHVGVCESDAGKVMGMSSYGNILDIDLLSIDIAKIGYPAGMLLEPIPENNFQLKYDYAATIQYQTENKLLELVEKYTKQYGINDICIVGGYGYNSVNNTKLDAKYNTFVPHVAGDAGCSLGCCFDGDVSKTSFNIYAGTDFVDEIDTIDESKFVVKKYDDYNRYLKNIATDLKLDNIVCVHNGKSESGPRALGNRSILCNPSFDENRDRINNIKKRELYRPLAGTMLAEHMTDYFIDPISTIQKCGTMLYVLNGNEKAKSTIPAMLHVDHTCRVQSLTRDNNKHYYDIIEKFYTLTGIPAVLNTSLNMAGKPLAETLNDSLGMLLNNEFNTLYYAGKYKICKRVIK